jgi:DNA polymerase-3 subunit beta
MFKTDKAALSAALASARSVIADGSKMSIMRNVLIERGDGGLIARGGNIDMEIAARFAATIAADFEPFTCVASAFAEFVAKAPDNAITVERANDGGSLTHIALKSGRSRLKLPVLPASDFPKLDAGRLQHAVTLASEVFAEALDGVAFAAGSDISQIYLCGVLVEGSPEGLNLVATNGAAMVRRLLGKLVFDTDADAAEFPRIIIPSGSIAKIVKVAKEADDVTFEASDQMVRLTAGGTVLISKLIEGVFPEWQKYIPRANDILVSVGRQSLLDAIGRVLLATPDAGNGVAFMFGKDTLKLTARDVNAGEGEDEIGIEAAEEMTTGYNGKRMQELLAHMQSDRIEILLSEPRKPALIRSPGDDINVSTIGAYLPKGGAA